MRLVSPHVEDSQANGEDKRHREDGVTRLDLKNMKTSEWCSGGVWSESSPRVFIHREAPGTCIARHMSTAADQGWTDNRTALVE